MASHDTSAATVTPSGTTFQPSPQRVLLLPGIWMPAWSMSTLGKRLASQGFSVCRHAYPGVQGGPEASLDWLRPALREADAVVCHSLGGLMTLEALRAEPDLPIQRVVCIGSPLQGSGFARMLRARQHLRWAVGRSGDLLGAGCALPWPGKAQVGMVAGSLAFGVGPLLGVLEDPGDGTVALAETRWPALSDHRVVHASHSGLLLSREVAFEVGHFLRHGQFRPDAGCRSQP